jgi:hypothetical protein
MNQNPILLAALPPLLLLLAGCSTAPSAPIPTVSAQDFAPNQAIDNPFLPLKPGSTWTYDSKDERVDIKVQQETTTINGVQAIVVRDTVYKDGKVAEDTTDWYAQDRHGNVWYLGEDTKEYENGKVTSTAGTWKWGVDGARPGYAMKADTRSTDPYYQEYSKGVAEDQAQVLAHNRTATTPAGVFKDTLTNREWSPLKPGNEEEKTYARGVGMVLLDHTKGSTGSETLRQYHIA